MGAGTFTRKDWDSYTRSRGYTATSTVDALYSRTDIKADFDPKNFTIREACDSDEHPNSTPIIIGLDVTGSMSSVLETVSKRLADTITEIYDREPVKDPQICYMAFGDTYCDYTPIQVTQFESDIRIAEQLNDIYFERGGGGNDGESYTLPWYIASRRCRTDAWDKHGKKGFLFTVGDENCLPELTKEHVKEFLGDDIEADLSAEELLSEVSRKYEVYHLIVRPVRYQDPVKTWDELLGNNSIMVEDIDKIPEIIVSILELHAGKSVDEIVDSWDGSTAMVIDKALRGTQITAKVDNDGFVSF